MKKFGVLIALTYLLTGCGNNYRVTYDSVPQGATLICNGQNYGYTPRTLNFNKKAVMSGPRVVSLDECSANWASGARKNYGSFSPHEFPNGVHTTVKRPNEPGYQIDAEYELKVKQMNNQNNQNYAPTNNTVRCSRTIGGEVTEFKGTFCPIGYIPTY